MGVCSISFEEATINNHKSDAKHCDNDWLGVVWTINEQTISRTFKVLDRDGHYVLVDGSQLAPIFDSIDCGNQDTVTCTVMLMNLSAVDLDSQTAAATKAVSQAAQELAEVYIKVAVSVLNIAADLGAPEIAAAISAASGAVLSEFSDQLTKAIGTLFNDVLAPALEAVMDEANWLLGGQPNCNGEVLHDAFVSVPNTPRDEFRRNVLYQGPQKNPECGNPPHTTVTWWLIAT